jgi:FkbM family methyltransferase
LTSSDRARINFGPADGSFRRRALVSLCLPLLKNAADVQWALDSGLVLPAFVLNNGYTIKHRSDDELEFLFYETYICDSYLRGFYIPTAHDTILDIGANIGVFALRLLTLNDAVNIHCFEPAADTRKRLKENVLCNGVAARIAIHPFAVYDRCGPAQLRMTRASGHRSLFDYDRVISLDSEACQCVDLAAALKLCQSDVVALIKIDVEGAEPEILESASDETLARVARIVVEYHDYIRPHCGDRVVSRLRNHGFAHVCPVPNRYFPARPHGLVYASR